MWRRLHQQPDRVIPAVFGAYFVVAAIWLYDLWRDDRTTVFFEPAWPAVFLLAGLLSIAYAFHPHDRHLAAWSGGLMLASCLSRAAVILVAAHDGTIELIEARAWLTAATWSILAYAIGTIWTRFLRPLGEGRRGGG